jgi:hypothetical protein
VAVKAGKKMSDLVENVLKMLPPIMHIWFLDKFSEPVKWHNARLAFTRTTAVWSMVGHIVGLGDRHGENILLDASSGDCVQVDFSCLFDKVDLTHGLLIACTYRQRCSFPVKGCLAEWWYPGFWGRGLPLQNQKWFHSG